MDTKNIRIITVLALVAVLLGFMVLNKKSATQEPEQQQTNNQQTQGQEQPLGQNPELDKNLTVQEKQLLYGPGPEASETERESHFRLAEGMAVAGTSIALDECVASPVVLKIKLGDKVTVRNTGSTSIQFALDQENKVEVKAGGSATIDQSKFKYGAGLYGYGCEGTGLSRAVGMILVTP